ncbi:hypothetical protein FocTR4_00008583 [Fusarium oxysporum f. sp. cubense]|uniref:Uncharacterized protein n=1 Tax=Fusarium oxysporum f. sp. cubense TaxID=61366 RepID=A0A5C6SSL7_FUSOC|nr:hypothetical protein FocTR4_00008583 [Fusarium oxysporum f. sp. cubense]
MFLGTSMTPKARPKTAVSRDLICAAEAPKSQGCWKERPAENWSSPLIYRTDGSPNCFHSSNGSQFLICPIWPSLIDLQH